MNANTKGIVLIPTNDRHMPFLIDSKEGQYRYLGVKVNGHLTGDAFSREELNHYCKDMDFSLLDE